MFAENKEASPTLKDDGNSQMDTIDINKLSKEYPLRHEHYFFLCTQAINYCYYTAQRMALFFLFTYTAKGCNIKDNLALMYIISTACETMVIPLTGYICDHFKEYNHILILVTFSINFALSIIIYFLFVFKFASSEYILIAINVIQSLVDMQYNNSLYKLTKLFIDYDTKCNDDATQSNNIQTTYFTRIGIWGRFLAQNVICLMVIPSFLVMKEQYTSFYFVQYLLIMFVIIYGVFMYYGSSKVSKLFTDNPSIYGERIEAGKKSKDELLINAQLKKETETNNSWYFCESFRFLFIDNKITRYGIVNVILVFLLSDLMSSYEPLTIAGVDTDDDNKKLSNFCGNYLTNIMYQSVFRAGFMGIGALLYIYLLLPFIDSYHFYRYIYPIASIFVGVGVFIISGFDSNIDDQTLLSVSLGFILAFFTYAHQYDDFLNLGYINIEAVGFYQIIYSWSNNIWQIFGYLFLYLNVLNVAVATMIVVLLVSSVIQSLFFSRLFKPK